MRTAQEMGWSERTVTVNRVRLINTLKANQEKHMAEYKEAVAGYQDMIAGRLQALQKKALDKLRDQYSKLVEKIQEFDLEDPDCPIADRVVLLSEQSISLQVPKDHSRDYQVALEMAEWEVGENVELTQSQFQCFVLDDWDWKRGFEHLNKTYTAKKF